MGLLDNIFSRLGYQKRAPVVSQTKEIQKSDNRESMAYNPLSWAFMQMNSQWGLRKPSKITFQTLRRMSQANWVDRTCIFTLRDEITSIPWNISPINDKQPYDVKLQEHITRLLKKPNKNNENWRTLIDKVVEDILVVDAGCIEKVRNDEGIVSELYHVDGATIKPLYDEHGVVANPAYQQFLPGQKEMTPRAEFNNDDLIYMMWNPQGAVENFGFGMSPVEAGLAVGTAFLWAEAYNLGFFKTNTIPPMIINLGKEVQSGEVEKFRTFLAAEMMGEGGFHAPVIGSFGEGFSVNPIFKAPADMAWKEYVTWQMRWKVALYRMSPQDIGFTLDQYKVEGQVQQQLSKNKAINSLKDVIKNYIETEILGDKGFKKYNYNLEFNWVDTEAVDPLKQAQIDDIYIKTAVKKINDVRADLGLDPVEGGQKPLLILGSTVLPLSAAPMEQEQDKPTYQKVKKSLSPSEGTIPFLKDEQGVTAWMDDRGVTQPLFVTDNVKKNGFSVKPTFLDDRKGQKPPEEKVSLLLRSLKMNTPEVKILTYDQVLALLPTYLYPEFTKWVNLEPPYDSQTWRQRWGDTRKDDTYIVTGYLTGTSFSNSDFVKQVATSPDSYMGAIRDLARVWVGERLFFLGDRKPGHYIITEKGNGFGVDYSFYQDRNSWQKTSVFLPKTMLILGEKVKEKFDEFVMEEAKTLDVEDLEQYTEKAFRSFLPKNWKRMDIMQDIEKKIARRIQRAIWNWYKRATNYSRRKRITVNKTESFDVDSPYIISGDWVYQQIGTNQFKRYSLTETNLDPPSIDDIGLGVGDYKSGWDYGVDEATKIIKPMVPYDVKLSTPELLQGAFQDRINLVANTVNDNLKDAINSVITRGISTGDTYGEIAQSIQQTLGVNEDDPDMPGWRAERIGRTEAQWAISEGMREMYDEAGIDKLNISPAADACDDCLDMSDDGPYTTEEAADLLPIHPNCRCVLVGDYSDFLKSINKETYTQEEAKEVGDRLDVDWNKYSLDEFTIGMNEEMEHKDITKGKPVLTAKIVMAHLREDLKYYTKLASVMKTVIYKPIININKPKEKEVNKDKERLKKLQAVVGSLKKIKDKLHERPKYLPKRTEVLKSQDHYDFKSTQLNLPEDTAIKIQEFANSIPDDKIDFGAGGRESETHVTILYGLDNKTTIKQVVDVVKDFGSISITLGKMSVFKTDKGHDVLKLTINSQKLTDLHNKIKSTLNCPGYTFPEYQPHVTVAYLKQGEGMMYDGNMAFEGQVIEINELSFSDNDGVQVPISFIAAFKKADEGEHWITTQSGAHILIGADGKVVSGHVSVASYPKNAADITTEQKMAQAEVKDIKAQMRDDINEIRGTDFPEHEDVSGEVTKDTVDTIRDNMRNEAESMNSYLATDTALKLRDANDEFISAVRTGIEDGSLKGVDAKDLDSLGRDMVQKMVYQEVESNRQQFTDHGIRHIVGDNERALTLAEEFKGEPLTGREQLTVMFIGANHDVGYTTPLVREGGLRGIMVSGDHPAFSEKILGQQMSAWNQDKIFSEAEYGAIRDIVATHDAATMNADYIGTGFRVSDNLSMFSSEKLPSMFRYVEGGSDTLVQMGEAAKNNDTELFNSLRTGLHDAIDDTPNMSDNLKRDLKAATGEITMLTPKFTLGTLAGDISNISKVSGRVEVDVKYSALDSKLQKMFDMGQYQTSRFLKAYGIHDYTKSTYNIGDNLRLKIVGAPTLLESKSIEKADAGEGTWITVGGRHILIGGDKDEAGGKSEAQRVKENSGGDCYESAYTSFNREFSTNKDAKLVHGEVTGQGKIAGIKYGHAWVETKENGIDTVVDRSMGRNIRMPKALYYTIGRVSKTKSYTAKQVYNKIDKTRVYGPWDLKTKY